ncbi:hypothetical protein [Streptomyces qinglanensis]|uniref:hypothetical protein n=1 Tax=Streptomyces qinglanensis TaxID=943816 RepID=UPI000943DCDC
MIVQLSLNVLKKDTQQLRQLVLLIGTQTRRQFGLTGENLIDGGFDQLVSDRGQPDDDRVAAASTGRG